MGQQSFVNIGEGKLYAIAALAGALAGPALFRAVYPRLQAPLRLPPLAAVPASTQGFPLRGPPSRERVGSPAMSRWSGDFGGENWLALRE